MAGQQFLYFLATDPSPTLLEELSCGALDDEHRLEQLSSVTPLAFLGDDQCFPFLPSDDNSCRTHFKILDSRYEKTCNCQGFKALISVNKATLGFKLKLPKNSKNGRGKNHYSGCHFSMTKESKTYTPFHGMFSFHGTSSLEEPTPDLQKTQGSMASFS